MATKAELQATIDELEEALAGRAEDATIEMLDSLCVALESGRASVPQTADQWRRCLTEIAAGNDWENGTWK